MKTYKADPQDHDAVARGLLDKYRDQHANPIDGCTVRLDDQGQDFLEFDIYDQKIVATRPFQGAVWNGREVENKTLALGDHIRLVGWFDQHIRTLNYPVVAVRALTVHGDVRRES